MNVLVVEDEPGAREAIVELVKELGYEATGVGTVADATDALTRLRPDVCISDLGLPDGDGLDVVRAAKAAGRDCAVVVLTGRGSVRSAVEAMKAGAHDFLLKPLRTAQLAATLAQLSERHDEARGAQAEGLPDPATEGGLAGMVGRSAPMLEVYRLLTRVARSNAPVMITGESGTGKEIAASTVHLLSRRATRPFIAVNCGAISPTLVESELFGHEKGAFTGADRRRAGTFEMAHGGTLFLD
ncbi:MAG TPA: sigma 54-interacting transcriptional regulator, partial [Thermoanaerobaculia bacterium]|nr:sigma 54-interacting transcriptional regulator [Thermoanaerobaculia bacterium]